MYRCIFTYLQLQLKKFYYSNAYTKRNFVFTKFRAHRSITLFVTLSSRTLQLTINVMCAISFISIIQQKSICLYTLQFQGERPSGSQEQFEDKEICPEQKWQSLGKIFRRQSFEHWSKSPSQQQGECSSSSKRLAVKKVLSSYFGKKACVANEK